MPNRIREFRERARPPMSQEALARKVNLSLSTIRRCERGETPTLTTAWAIARGLNKSVATVFPEYAEEPVA